MENKFINKKILKKVLSILVSSFVYAICIKLIVQQNKFLSGGVSGLTILISRYISIKMDNVAIESLLYSILYVVFNIPIFFHHIHLS